MNSRPVTLKARCPILNDNANPVVSGSVLSCPVTQCMHNQNQRCRYVETSDLEGDLERISSMYVITPEDVVNRAGQIQKALVANARMMHVTGRSVMDARPVDFDETLDIRQADNFKEWNKSLFDFSQIVATLELLRSRL